MGNCCFKNHQDPNHPVGIPQAPTGVDEIKFSGPRKTPPLQKMNLSLAPNTRKEVDETFSRRGETSKPLGEISPVTLATWKGSNENQISHEKNVKPLGERNPSASSNSQKGVTEIQRPSKSQEERNPCFPLNRLKENLKKEERESRAGVMRINMKDEVFNAYKLHPFCYNVLKAATEKFSERNQIGRGGFGDVYKGWIDRCTMTAAKPGCGLLIAVKTLRKEGSQGCHEWLNEIKFLSRVNHPNVVELIGYCSQGENRILVYEYMTKGSLEARLLRRSDTELKWRRRIRIAIESAKGLEYLHTARPPIVHRDLKSSNILLHNGFIAKLSDFGLARFGPQDDETHVSTRVLGTKGYFAPEYISTGHLTLKTDVYSFGVVLLEILSGSAAVKRHSDGVAGDLTEWATPYLNNRLELHRVIDKRLRRNLKMMEEAYEFAGIIRHCLSSEPKDRPNMTQVVHALEKLEQKVTGGDH